MNVSPATVRTSTMQSGDLLRHHVQRTQTQQMDVQRQMSTGLKYGMPSDGTADASSILFLRHQVAGYEQIARNLGHGQSMLNMVDGSLGEATDMLREAHSTAMGEMGVNGDAGSRQAAAQALTAQIDGLIELANQKHQGVPLFGGKAGDSGLMFEHVGEGIRYHGSSEAMKTMVGAMEPLAVNTTGPDAFGALSERIVSQVDLDPRTSESTRIVELNGARERGVELGAVRLTVNGQTAEVDLRRAETLGDVADRLNEAIAGIDPTAGQVSVTADGFELEAGAGHDVAIAEQEGGRTAKDLGLELSASNGGVEVGPELHRRLMDTTSVDALGADVDWASGIEITMGGVTEVVDFSGAQTVEDLKNTIDGLDLGLRLEVNEGRTGLNLVSEVSGPALSVGENGGSTASDLGLRTLGMQTKLDDFRDGRGVSRVDGADMRISLHDGRSFKVDLSEASTVGAMYETIIDAANDAGIAAGFDPADELHLGMAAQGNGMVMRDNTAGGDAFVIQSVGHSMAADQLGLAGSASAGEAIDSGDQAQVRVQNVFTHLMDLRDALEANDESGMAVAGERLEKDIASLGNVRGSIGAQAKRLDDQQQRLEDRKLMDQTMLSELEDADLIDVITRFTQLQHQMQASLMSGAQNMQMSLLDFLR